LVALAVATIVIGVVWVSRNKDAWIAKGKEVMTEGRDSGRNTDNQGCVDESVSRYKKDAGFTATLSTNLFMRACLDSSRPTPGFCNDIPRQTEFLKSAQWRLSQCRRVDLEADGNCQNLFMPVQQFCDDRTRKEE
jgi:hypothetical protein